MDSLVESVLTMHRVAASKRNVKLTLEVCAGSVPSCLDDSGSRLFVLCL